MKRVVAVILFLIGIAACGKDHEAKKKPAERPEVRGVKVERMMAKDIERFYETSGTVEAETVSILSSKVMGQVTSVRVQDGDRVRKGQLLMTIDDSDIAKKVQAAEAAHAETLNGLAIAKENRELAAVTYERFKRLFDEKALTKQEMDEMETRKRVSEAQVSQAEAMVQRSEASLQEARTVLGYTRITSPIDGIVSERKIDLGTMASPGMPLLIIEDPSLYTININADERLFAVMKKGMQVKVSLPSLGLETTGAVTEIAQAVDPATRTFLVKVAAKGKGIRSGFYANVALPEGKARVIAVPSGAVIRRGQLTGLFVVDDNKIVTFRLMRTGKELNGLVEVLSGLNEGELVIVSGAEKALDGGILAE